MQEYILINDFIFPSFDSYTIASDLGDPKFWGPCAVGQFGLPVDGPENNNHKGLSSNMQENTSTLLVLIGTIKLPPPTTHISENLCVNVVRPKSHHLR